MLKRITTIVLILTITNTALADCQYALNACNAYVKALEKDNKLCKDKVAILEKAQKPCDKIEQHSESAGKSGILVAGGVGIGAAAVAVGAPVIAVGIGLGALIIALIGK